MLSTTAAVAQQPPRGTFNLLIENDKFTGTDRHYTNGVQLSYLSGKDRVPRWLRNTARYLPGIQTTAALRTGYVLGHSIFTPDDITTAEPLPDERPYAGWLYGGVALVAETENRLDTWELDLGIVGPSARGEEVQNSFHRLIGVNEANGWDNQLKDEFGYALIYERKWRNLWEHRRTGFGLDLIPHIGGSLGNVGTYLDLGATLRIGNDLPNDFGAPRIRPSLPGSNFFLPRDNFGWYLFAGVSGRAVAYTIFLDGNTIKNSLSVDREPLVGDLQAGLVTNLGWARLAYTYVYRTREFKGQEEPDHFGSIGLSVKF
ncbi:MAG: lipid A deacylase LpxR family protein [Candidatus Competibacteraceae bacterium]|nr:lipid A deacylase LpxR family protein [Candidatus Competibacteraceae bacterium]